MTTGRQNPSNPCTPRAGVLDSNLTPASRQTRPWELHAPGALVYLDTDYLVVVSRFNSALAILKEYPMDTYDEHCTDTHQCDCRTCKRSFMWSICRHFEQYGIHLDIPSSPRASHASVSRPAAQDDTWAFYATWLATAALAQTP